MDKTPLSELKLAYGTAPTHIARICHEANRAYCVTLGDNSQAAWVDAPKWQRESAIDGVRFHLEHPEAGPEASHENWLRQKVDDGWIHGPVKDEESKTHPCLIPFNRLPHEQQRKDFLFRAIVHAVAFTP